MRPVEEDGKIINLWLCRFDPLQLHDILIKSVILLICKFLILCPLDTTNTNTHTQICIYLHTEWTLFTSRYEQGYGTTSTEATSRLSLVSSLEQYGKPSEEILEFVNMFALNKVLVGVTVYGKSTKSTFEPNSVIVIKWCSFKHQSSATIKMFRLSQGK